MFNDSTIASIVRDSPAPLVCKRCHLMTNHIPVHYLAQQASSRQQPLLSEAMSCCYLLLCAVTICCGTAPIWKQARKFA